MNLLRRVSTTVRRLHAMMARTKSAQRSEGVAAGGQQRREVTAVTSFVVSR